ncbi:MAG: transporter related protein [Acidimicrobiales bacterium]|nr:transporter related protein [Acidimicrobiales bacterium]
MTTIEAERAVVPSEPFGGGSAIRTTELTKRFGDVAVVDRLNLEVPAGSVFGFLGPNGSGKTTTIRMLLGLIAPSEGEVQLLGRTMPGRAAEALPRVGALVEGPAFYPWLSGRQNLERIDAAGPEGDAATRRTRIELALERVGLTAAGKKKYKAYSLGMRQRLGLASALLRRRELLILDEPTNGMDPQGTREIRNLIRELAADGTTVFLSSHLLAEIEQVCTHVAVMSLGRLLSQGSLAALQSDATPVMRVDTVDVELALGVVGARGLSGRHDDRSVSAELGGQAPEDLCRLLVEAGVRVTGFAVERPSLEDVFVSLTGEGFDVAR